MNTENFPGTVETLDGILRNAKSYVAKGWIQGANARDSDGVEVQPHSEKAVCWCLTGALSKAIVVQREVEEDCTGGWLVAILTEATKKIGMSHWEWNDVERRTKKEVLELLESMRPGKPYKEGEAA